MTVKARSLVRIAGCAGLVFGFLPLGRLAAQPPAPALPEGAAALKIVVNSVTGTVQYQRDGRFQRLTADSVLQQGDAVTANVGSVCKLVFQHPTSNAVLSASILRGYTQMTVAQAYQQGEQSRTQLDVTQGVIRAGVVRTATPPSFQVRTPRVVVGVRGTEIAELEASDDLGDRLLMGRIGIAMTHDAVPLYRSTRAGQGTLKRVEGDRRGDTLVRAIENANLESRVLLTGPHRSAMETDFDRQSFDRVEFPGEVGLDLSSGRSFGQCPFCTGFANFGKSKSRR